MRNFNSDVQGFVKKHRTQKRLAVLSIILAVAVLLSVIASLIEPAISATNLKETNKTVSDAIMLVGENNVLYSAGDTVADVIAKANDRYALGIASQFSVFLETDFKTTAADTEGRLAVGGNLDPSGYLYGTDGGDGYRVGLGHYVDSYASINLVDSQFGGTYAHAIVGGTVGQKLATKPSVKETYEADDKTKTTRQRYFLVNADSNVDSSYDKTAFYTKTSDVLDFTSAFSLLKQRSGTISVNAKKVANTTVTIDEANNTVTFTGPGENVVADSIMFNVTAEQWATISKMSSPQFIFTDIPKLATPLTGTEVWGNDDCNTANCYATHNATVNNVTWENTYIIVNVEGDGSLQMPQSAVQTSVNGYWINKGGTNNGETYANVNNKFGCSTLLYNFSEATGLKLGGDFQGSILAPLADVTDMSTGTKDGCKGHLSGALVAKSFDGATEFGYRSYTGPLEVLGTTTHYRINVDKLDDSSQYLAGAQLGLYTVDESGNLSAEPVYSWTSGSASETIEVDAGTKYAVKEISAPTGYIKSEEVHYFTVTESEKQQANASYTETVTTIIPGTTKITKIAFNQGSDKKYFEKLTIAITDGSGTTTEYKGANHILSGSGPSAIVNVTQATINGTTVYTMNSFTAIDAVSVSVTSEKDKDSVTVFLYGENDTLLATIADVNKNNAGSWVSTTQGGTVTEDVTYSQSFTYVPSVTLTVYNDNKFTQTKSQTTISTTDLNNTAYEIGNEIVSGTDIESRKDELGVAVATSGNNYFVIQNGMPLTPIVDTGTFTVVNQKEITQEGADFTIQAFEKDNPEMGVTGSNYYVYTEDGTKVTKGEDTHNLGESIKDKIDNKNLLEGKLPPGTYYLQQNQAPTGDYVLPDSSTELKFTVNDDGTVTIPDSSKEYLEYDEDTSTLKIYYTKTAEDPDEGETQVGTDFTILAYDKDTGSSLWNSNYVLYSNDGTTVSRDNEYCWLNQSVAGQVKNEYKTDDGKLKPGTYYFVQNQSPSSDYVVPNNSTRLEFTVNSDGTITVSDNSSEYIEYDESTSTLKVYYSKTAENPDEGETQVGADITLQKVDKTDGTALSGATIALYDASNDAKIYEFSGLGTVNISGYIGEAYKLDGKLKPGSYYLMETTAPSGYTLPTGVKMYFTVATDGSVSVDSGSESYLIYESQTLKILNTKESSGGDSGEDSEEDEQQPTYQIGIDKFDSSSTYLAGAKFEVYSISDTDEETKIAEFTSGTDRYYIELPVGTYKLVEVEAPEGYTVAEPIIFKVEEIMVTAESNVISSESELLSVADSQSESDKYPYDYTIENILSTYEVFVSGDFIGQNHFTGAVASGGLMDYAAHGGAHNGRVFADYGYIVKRSVVENTVVNPKLYYGSLYSGVTAEDGWVQNADFINMNEAFGYIKQQSTKIAQDTTNILKPDSNGVLTINLSDNADENKFKISYSDWQKVTRVDVNSSYFSKDASDISKDIMRCGLTLSFIGVGDNTVTLNGEYGSPMFYYNNNSFRNAVHGQEQYNLDGTNILFNFPDATEEVIANAMAGHIVAPLANVTYNGGEGGAIAETVTVANEIHFFPYSGYTGDMTNIGEPKEVVTYEQAGLVETITTHIITINGETVEFVVVYNQKSSVTAVMPSTGGSGTTIYFAAGAMLIAVACIGLVVKRRMVRR